MTTGARLHFGLLSHGRSSGRNYGGCGMMIDAPGCRVRFSPGESDVITVRDGGQDERDIVDVVRRIRGRVRECTGMNDPVEVAVEQFVPRHAGLGSGTQLASAVVLGMSRLDGEEPLSVEELRRRSGRGRRSSIGLHGFLQGGFLSDSGRKAGEGDGRLDCRLDLPEPWRVVLLTPFSAVGLSSDAEREAFSRLPATTEDHVGKLARLLADEVLPAIRSADFGWFSKSLYEYGRRVGDAFAPVQGGTYSHRSTTEIVETLRALGVEGVGQTSWGPTVFAFAETESAAADVAESAGRQFPPGDVAIRVTKPLDRGATVRPC